MIFLLDEPYRFQSTINEEKKTLENKVAELLKQQELERVQIMITGIKPSGLDYNLTQIIAITRFIKLRC